MTSDNEISAWNNMVTHADPSAFEKGDKRRSAAIACVYMTLANNGGLNSFLTSSYDMDAAEVLSALEEIGAITAANQLRSVLDRLGEPLPVMSQDERWDRMAELWGDDLDALDVMTEEADRDLVVALKRHVSENVDYYSNFVAHRTST